MVQSKWKLKLFEVERESQPQKETCEKSDSRDDIFYAESLSAWYQTRLETDKAKLTISSGAIGLQITLYCAFAKNLNSDYAPIFLIASMLCFLMTIILSIIIFNKNATHIENVLSQDKPSSIGHFDVCSWVSFGLGMGCLIPFVILVAFCNSCSA